MLSKLPTNIHTNPYLYVRTLSMNHLFNRRHLSQLWSDILTRHFWWYRYHKTTPHKLSTSLEDGPKDLWKRTKIIVSEKSTTVISEIVLYKYPLFLYQVQSRDILIENHKHVTSATRIIFVLPLFFVHRYFPVAHLWPFQSLSPYTFRFVQPTHYGLQDLGGWSKGMDRERRENQ